MNIFISKLSTKTLLALMEEEILRFFAQIVTDSRKRNSK